MGSQAMASVGSPAIGAETARRSARLRHAWIAAARAGSARLCLQLPFDGLDALQAITPSMKSKATTPSTPPSSIGSSLATTA